MKEGGRVRVLFRPEQTQCSTSVSHEYFFILWIRQSQEASPLLSALFQAAFTICYC